MEKRYHLEHLTEAEKAKKILDEILKIEGVKKITISKDLKKMEIQAEDNRFTEIMDRVVNICKRVSKTEVSYMF